MAKHISIAKKFLLIAAAIFQTTSEVYAVSEYTHCDTAYVPCPRAPGFQFFNKTCYGIIRDPMPFGAGDSYFKCESGMYFAFAEVSSLYTRQEQRSAMNRRLKLARVVSFGTLNVLAKLRRQVVPELRESTLVDLACSEDCTLPASWTFSGSDAFPYLAGNCLDTPACNWQLPGGSVWHRPPGSRPAIAATTPGGTVKMPAINASDADSEAEGASLNHRRAVLVAPGALRDAPETISLHSLACEIPYTTNAEEIQYMLPLGLAADADMTLNAQMVQDLVIESINDSRTRVRLQWRPPQCQAPAFFVTVQSDAEETAQNRSQVEFEDVCDEELGYCELALQLPLCSLLYIEVGAILEGEDAAPDVVQWSTPAPGDPPTPEYFVISEISGSVVTFAWESAAAAGPCQPHHEVTVRGHGKVTLKPGIIELKADLDDHCIHFDASITATILGRNSSVRGPIHGVTGPTAPDTLEVMDLAATWSVLEWSHDSGSSSPCVQAKYRVTCRPVQGPGNTVDLISPARRLNVTGLLPGVQYRCGVCALASMMDTSPSDTAMKKPPCGDVRHVDLTTNETAPGMPHGLNITDTGHESLLLEWYRPLEPNGVIIRYNVSTTCEPETFPLCNSDPLCVDRWFDVPLEGNDTDHVTFTVTGLQAARLHHVTVSAATAAGQGPFSQLFSADTRVGVPPPPTDVLVTSRVKKVVGHAEQTSISVSLRPPCPYPGPHDYRLQFERVDFLAGYRSTVRAAILKPEEIRQLYSGDRNITFSVFDGKWTPGFKYVVRIVAHTDNNDLGKRAHAPSAPVSFTMTVPPPGEVRDLKIDCASQPLHPSYRWANPTENAFGIVGYRSRYQCEHPTTGHQVTSEGWHSCQHSQCPCASSLARSNQCVACERVCNYPVKRFIFRGARTYFFNCTCSRRLADDPVMPGSECEVAVQAESKYLQQPGTVTLASCRTPPHTARVTELEVSCRGEKLSALWAVPKPLEVATDAFQVSIQWREEATGRQDTFFAETVGTSQCRAARCRAEWPGVVGDVTYTVRVAAESVYSSPSIGPAAETSCLSPARVPLPPSERAQERMEKLSGWREDLDPSHQYLLHLPHDLYDAASGTLREIRVSVSEAGVTSTTSLYHPASGNFTELPPPASWRQFRTGRSDHYQASPPAFVPVNDGTNAAEFVLGGDLPCSLEAENTEEESHCNGPLSPDTSYAVQLMFVNNAGFASSRPFTFRTKSIREVQEEKADRAGNKPEAEQAENSPAPSDGTKTGQDSQGSEWGVAGRSGLAFDLPDLEAAPSDTAQPEDAATAAPAAATSGTPAANTTTHQPEEEAVPVGTVVGASVGSLAALVSLIAGVCLWRRRAGGNG